jgi:hypothetical protein
LYANPAEEQVAIWMVVASAGTMSQLPDFDKPGTTAELLVILEELKKSLLNNSVFGEASDAIFCIPMM